MISLPITLADTDPSGADIKTWLLVASFLANVALVGIALLGKMMGKAEKREISGTIKESPDFMTKKEFDQINRDRIENVGALRSEIISLRSHIDKLIEMQRAEMRGEDQRLHERVDEVHDRINTSSSQSAATNARLEEHLRGAFCKTSR